MLRGKIATLDEKRRLFNAGEACLLKEHKTKNDTSSKSDISKGPTQLLNMIRRKKPPVIFHESVETLSRIDPRTIF